MPGHVVDAPSHELQTTVPNPVLANLLGNDGTGGSLPAGTVRIKLTQVLAAAVGLSHDPRIEPETIDPSEEPAT